MPKKSQEFPGLELRYKRFALEPGQRIGPLISKTRRRGIYILEFTNGEYYVGQAKNVVTRFAQLRHGHTNHDEPWDDIAAVQFAFVPESINLNIAEAHEIRRLRDEGLPNAVELESRYWTISDYPSTSGGRWATVNTGPIEAMFFPRKFPIEFSNDDGETITLPATAINLSLEQGREPDADGFFLNGIYWFVENGNSAGEVSGANSVSSHNQDTQERPLPIYSDPVKYKSVTCEHLVVPTGYAEGVLMDFPGLLERARKFVIAAMRQNECGMYRRWHSEQLAAEVYEGILQRWQE